MDMTGCHQCCIPCTIRACSFGRVKTATGPSKTSSTCPPAEAVAKNEYTSFSKEYQITKRKTYPMASASRATGPTSVAQKQVDNTGAKQKLTVKLRPLKFCLFGISKGPALDSGPAPQLLRLKSLSARWLRDPGHAGHGHQKLRRSTKAREQGRKHRRFRCLETHECSPLFSQTRSLDPNPRVKGPGHFEGPVGL